MAYSKIIGGTMKKMLFIFLTVLLFCNITADRLELRSGERVNGVSITDIKEGKLITDNEEYSVEDVAVIGFSETKQKGAKAHTASEKLSKRNMKKYLDYFAIGEKLAKKYSGIEFVHIIDIGVNQLNNDGTRSFVYKFLGYVVNPKAKEDLSKIGFYLDEERVKTSIQVARVITKDGNVYNYDPNDYKIVKPQTESWSYGGGQNKIYTIPNVEVGTLVEYEYTYESINPVNRKLFEPGFSFQGDVPVYLSRFTVRLPYYLQFKDGEGKNVYIENPKLKYKTWAMDKKSARPRVRNRKSYKEYTWEMKNMPPYIEEPMQKNIEDFLPRMEGSILKNRKELNDWIGRMEEERMEVTPEILEALEKIIDEKDSAEVKLGKIYHWIQKNIIYLSVKGSISSGLTGHPAVETLENKKGDCIDKAILFSTMIKALEIPELKVYPVTVKASHANDMTVDIPVIDGNHAISEVHFNDKIFYLDSTASSYRYPYFRGDDKGITAVNEILGTIKMIPVPDPKDEMNYYDVKMKFDKKGNIIGNSVGTYSGDYEARLRALYLYRSGEKEREAIFKSMVNSMSPKGDLTGFELTDVDDFFEPFVLKYSYVLTDFPTIAGNYMIFKIPGWDYYFPSISLQDRKYPIEYSTSRYTGHKIEIEIPKGYSIKYLPKPLEISNEDFHYKAEFKEENGKIIFIDSYKRFKRIIEPENYKRYREGHFKILEYTAKSVIIKK